jgi:hypothetical protein
MAQLFGRSINVFESFWLHIRHGSGEGEMLAERRKLDTEPSEQHHEDSFRALRSG